MNTKRLVTLAISIAAIAQMSVANAQSEKRSRATNAGWAAIARSGQIALAPPQFQQDQVPAPVAEEIEPQAVDPKKRIVGTWIVTVSPIGSPTFSSLQTYSDDGTMTETSSLLAQLDIGSARGVWEGKKNDYDVTFELFAFDPAGEAIGRLRVRAKVRLDSDDTLTADGVGDLIQPGGTIIPNIASTPFTGSRMKVVPVN
jgi:hypothetical protein